MSTWHCVRHVQTQSLHQTLSDRNGWVCFCILWLSMLLSYTWTVCTTMHFGPEQCGQVPSSNSNWYVLVLVILALVKLVFWVASQKRTRKAKQQNEAQRRKADKKQRSKKGKHLKSKQGKKQQRSRKETQKRKDAEKQEAEKHTSIEGEIQKRHPKQNITP